MLTWTAPTSTPCSAIQPGDMGADVVQLQSAQDVRPVRQRRRTGAVSIGVKKALEPFLPLPRVVKGSGGMAPGQRNVPIPSASPALVHGNFGMLAR